MHDGVYMELACGWKFWFPQDKEDIYFANSLKQQSTGRHWGTLICFRANLYLLQLTNREVTNA